MNAFVPKVALFLALAAFGISAEAWLTSAERPQVMHDALEQLHSDGQHVVHLEHSHQRRTLRRLAISSLVGAWGFVTLVPALAGVLLGMKPRSCLASSKALVLLVGIAPLVGCWRPFEPIQLETISPNEEAFLLPLTDDVKKQTSTNNEEYLKKTWSTPSKFASHSNGCRRDTKLLEPTASGRQRPFSLRLTNRP